MANAKRIHKLREEFNKARRRGKLSAALKALQQLEKLEPDEPRWPHQQGELYRLQGQVPEAADAWERAVKRYAEQGFVARAIALGKALTQLAPDRTHVLEAVDPAPAREAHRAARPQAFPSDGPTPAPMMASLRPLGPPKEEAAEDELVFLDLEEEELLEVDISELELVEDPPPVPMSIAPQDPKASGRTLDRLALLPSFPLFSELKKETLRRLALGSTLVDLPDGAMVAERGEEADALYCIVDGAARVVVPGPGAGPPEAVLTEGEIFGESCLLSHAERAADVFAQGALVALRIPKDTLDKAVESDERLQDILFELLTRRLMANLLSTHPLFLAFDADGRKELAGRFELRSVEPDTVLLERGKRSDGLYVVLQGSLRVGAGSGEHTIAGPGAILGQRSLLSRDASALTATAEHDCIVLRLPASRFSTFAALYPPALDHLTRLASTAELAGEGLGLDLSNLSPVG